MLEFIAKILSAFTCSGLTLGFWLTPKYSNIASNEPDVEYLKMKSLKEGKVLYVGKLRTLT